MAVDRKKVKRAGDTGAALALILILCSIYSYDRRLIVFAAVSLFLSMATPIIFAPLSRFWFGLSEVVGGIVSRIMLSILFYGILLPLGLIRRLTGANPLALKLWCGDKKSLFVVREIKFKAGDLEKPF
ncbi:MAG: hypothetical protein PVI90_11105 [Desulfobacteraceae bacterium]|jgi:hypothetical protein